MESGCHAIDVTESRPWKVHCGEHLSIRRSWCKVTAHSVVELRKRPPNRFIGETLQYRVQSGLT